MSAGDRYDGPMHTEDGYDDDAEQVWRPVAELRSTKPFGPAFPMQVLPAWIREYAEEVAWSTQCPNDLAAVSALSLLSTAVASRVGVRMKSKWLERAQLYSIVQLPPGTNKSACTAAMWSPITALEVSLQEQLAVSVAQRQARWDAVSGQVARMTKKLAELGNAQMEDWADLDTITAEFAELGPRPEMPTLTLQDVTPEELASIMASQGGRVALLSAEGGALRHLTGGYSKERNIDVYLHGHDGGRVQIARRGRREDFVAGLTIGLAVQPNVLSALLSNKELEERGLTPRFFYATPDANVGGRLFGHVEVEEADVSPDVDARYHRAASRLLMAFRTAEFEAGRKVELTLTVEARERFNLWQQLVEASMLPGGFLAGHAGWGSKFRGLTLRFAALLHLAADPSVGIPMDEPISLATLVAAIELAAWVAEHAVVTHGSAVITDTDTAGEAVIAWIRRRSRPRFTLTEVMKGNKSKLKETEDADTVLAMLEEFGWVRPAAKSKGHPGKAWEVNPAVFE